MSAEGLRLGVCADYRAEGWPSMDLCAQMLLDHLPPGVRAADVSPGYRPLLARLPLVGRRRAALNADRLWNRFVGYPRHLRGVAHLYDAFHLVDHSYAQVLLSLPRGRAGAYLHDLDTFRCLLDRQSEPRPGWFRRMARVTLNGLQSAAVVFYTTQAVRDQVLRHGLLDPARMVHAPNGVSPEFTAEPTAEDVGVLPKIGGRRYVLHVGSCIPRKRIGVLLHTFALLRAADPMLLLVKVGAAFEPEHLREIERLKIGGSIVTGAGLTRSALAGLYRRAGVVLMTSDAEGFGLPVVEALACGAPVVASDIPALREVGGDAVAYCPVGDSAAFAEAARAILDAPVDEGVVAGRLARAALFSWRRQAETIVDGYRALLQ